MKQTNRKTGVTRKVAFKPVSTPQIVKEKPQQPSIIPNLLKVQLIGLPEEVAKGKKALMEVLARSYVPEVITCNMLSEKEIREITKDYHVEIAPIEGKKYEIKGRLDDVKEAKFAVLEADRKVFKTIEFPSNWEPQTLNCELMTIQKDSTEWATVSTAMKDPSLQIIKLERIQNQFLYKKYCNELENIKTKNNSMDINEKNLFHGTHLTAPDHIYNSEEGFDMRFSRQGMWGIGIYFAQTSTYSDRYSYKIPTSKSGLKQMFLATVICGLMCTMNSDPSLRLPPERSTSDTSLKLTKPRYDSVSGITDGTQVHIVYSNSKAYPLYLITYKSIE